MTIDLPPGKRSTEVLIPQPATNVDYVSHVEAEPSWAKKLRAELGPIRMVISFRARNPATEYTAICSFVLEVRGTSHTSCHAFVPADSAPVIRKTHVTFMSCLLGRSFITLSTDREAPTVKNCPHDIHVRLSSLEPYANAPWTDPVFNDNIAVTHVIKSKVRLDDSCFCFAVSINILLFVMFLRRWNNWIVKHFKMFLGTQFAVCFGGTRRFLHCVGRSWQYRSLPIHRPCFT